MMLNGVMRFKSFEISGNNQTYSTALSTAAGGANNRNDSGFGTWRVGMVRSGVVVGTSSSGSGTALTIDATYMTNGKTWAALVNDGDITTKGGSGGAGGAYSSSMQAGSPGGGVAANCISVSSMAVDLYNNAYIRIGGGGGGGGANNIGGEKSPVACSSGGTGGNGAGNGSAATGGSAGAVVWQPACGPGAGGTGGTWGATGSSGGSVWVTPGGAGGTVTGLAVSGYSNFNVVVTGTITGTTSG